MQRILAVKKYNQIGNALKLLIVAVLMAGLGMAVSQQTAKADVILPGEEPVDYCYSINNLDAYPAYVVIKTTSRVDGPSVVNAGACNEVTVKNNEGNFFATHKAGFDASTLPKDASQNKIFTSSTAYLQANLRLHPLYVTDQKYNLEKVQDVLRIVSLTQTEFQLEFVKVVYTLKDGSTEELPYTSQDTRPAPSRSGLIPGGVSGVGQTLLNMWYFVIPAIALVAIVVVVVLSRRSTRRVH